MSLIGVIIGVVGGVCSEIVTYHSAGRSLAL